MKPFQVPPIYSFLLLLLFEARPHWLMTSKAWRERLHSLFLSFSLTHSLSYSFSFSLKFFISLLSSFNLFLFSIKFFLFIYFTFSLKFFISLLSSLIYFSFPFYLFHFLSQVLSFFLSLDFSFFSCEKAILNQRLNFILVLRPFHDPFTSTRRENVVYERKGLHRVSHTTTLEAMNWRTKNRSSFNDLRHTNEPHYRRLWGC